MKVINRLRRHVKVLFHRMHNRPSAMMNLEVAVLARIMFNRLSLFSVPIRAGLFLILPK